MDYRIGSIRNRARVWRRGPSETEMDKKIEIREFFSKCNNKRITG